MLWPKRAIFGSREAGVSFFFYKNMQNKLLSLRMLGFRLRKKPRRIPLGISCFFYVGRIYRVRMKLHNTFCVLTCELCKMLCSLLIVLCFHVILRPGTGRMSCAWLILCASFDSSNLLCFCVFGKFLLIVL